MQEFSDFWGQADAVGRAVAALLLLMSISAWVVIFWKGWVLQARAARPGARRAGLLGRGHARRRARSGWTSIDREAVLAALARRGHGAPRQRHAADLGPARFAADAAPARRAAPRPGAPAVRPGAAGVDRRHRALRRPVRHGLGHLPRAGQHLRGRQHHHREGRRPGGRGADHDGRRPGRGHPGGAGLQRLRQVGRRLRSRARRLCARPARDGARRPARPRPEQWHSAASNATPARGR